jgi:transcriptional regulator with XRE-family HTH domain
MLIAYNSSTNILALRLRQARESIGLPQDKLGVLIGLDEGCASARISRYESGIHQPPLKIVSLLAMKLNVPLAYLFCEDDTMAKIILKLSKLDKAALKDQLARIESYGLICTENCPTGSGFSAN